MEAVSLHGKRVTVVGAGPLGLGIARQAQEAGAERVEIVARHIPEDERSARSVTGGSAAGYGAPFATKNQEILAWAADSRPYWMEQAHDENCSRVAEINARTVTTDRETVEFLTQREEFLKGPEEIGVQDCYELRAFSFNPSGLLVDWVRELKESACEFRRHDVQPEDWQALLQGDNPFGTDVAVLCCGTGQSRFEEGRVEPVRGVLGHIKNVPLPQLGTIPTSAMYEDDLSKLVYLTPRPGRGKEWDLIVGGTFDKGQGECTEEYKREVMNDRLVRARELFAPVVPELMPLLDRPIEELTVGYRPRGLDGAPITEHRRAGSKDVFVFNGMSGQGWVTLPARALHAARFIAEKVARSVS